MGKTIEMTIQYYIVYWKQGWGSEGAGVSTAEQGWGRRENSRARH